MFLILSNLKFEAVIVLFASTALIPSVKIISSFNKWLCQILCCIFFYIRFYIYMFLSNLKFEAVIVLFASTALEFPSVKLFPHFLNKWLCQIHCCIFSESKN